MVRSGQRSSRAGKGVAWAAGAHRTMHAEWTGTPADVTVPAVSESADTLAFGAGIPDTQPLHQLRQRRVRLIALGQDGLAVAGDVHERPSYAHCRIIPCEAELVRAVVLIRHEVEELQRL